MKDAFLTTLRGGKPRRPVWTADISYWLNGRKEDGTVDPAWATEEGYLKLHQELGIMPYYDYAHFWAGSRVFDDSVTLHNESAGNRSRAIMRTPLGDMTTEAMYLPESACGATTRHYVNTADDLDRLLHVLEHSRLVPANLDDFAARQVTWARYGGYSSLALPRSPLASFCYEWAGLENAIMLLMDHEVKVRRIFDLIAAQQEPILDAVCRLAPPVVHFADNLSSDNFTSLYDEFMAPGHHHRLERLHAAGVKAAVHLDGMIRGLLPKLAAVGFDAVEALTPKPVGDVGLEEMRGVAGSDRLILWGGVPGAMFAPPYKWADMQAHLEKLLACWGGTPFIIGVADQVPPDGDISFCRKIAEMLMARFA
ncbi:MAG: hypothetical protein PHR35_01890 [Kiritimatiellae bacterium]|nr:hypothetical protein [Kiritimatiellia bacterium]